jgi:Ricin-type beta-trefoil lectin domain/Somatomedin B domain
MLHPSYYQISKKGGTMQGIELSARLLAVRAATRVFWQRATVIGVCCGALAACGPVNGLGGASGDEDTDNSQSAGNSVTGSNGLGRNGLGLNGLNIKSLGSHALAASGTVTSATQTWLNTAADADNAMTYIVKCAAPRGTTVRGTINGQAKTWTGEFGVASSWLNNALMNQSQQEWMSACLAAHVNLAGSQVTVSFRTSDNSTIPYTSADASYKCREAAFMGNLFQAGSDPLPMVQCHDHGARSGNGRLCDPQKNSFECLTDCALLCNQPAGGSGSPLTSCSANVNGSTRTYSRIISTYLPIDPTQGCLGWGENFVSRSVDYNSGGWSWQWGPAFFQNGSCSAHCGGYSESGCSCTPDCGSHGNCCSDYQSLCGTPPPYIGWTSAQSTCPAGYNKYTGQLASGGLAYYPSTSGVKAKFSGAQHATLLGPTGSHFRLNIEAAEFTAGISNRGNSNESLHYFFGEKDTVYRWQLYAASGMGAFTLCMNNLATSFALSNKASQQCLGAYNGGSAAGVAIGQSACSSRSYQAWLLWNSNKQIVNVNSAMCIGLSGSSTTSSVVQKNCSDSGTNWYVTKNSDGSKTFKSMVTNYCLASVSGGIAQQACNSSNAAQRFSQL